MLSSSCVPRGVVLLERDAYGEWHTIELKAAIALARCPRCGTRTRVLPYDILPYKRYSLAVISALVSTYATWSLSLRRVVWDLLGERTPAHTTLHGWTEGLGAHALGLPGAQLKQKGSGLCNGIKSGAQIRISYFVRKSRSCKCNNAGLTHILIGHIA